MPYEVFISHSKNDKSVADAMCARLEEAGIGCWIAPRNLLPGSEWVEAIMDGIGRCRIMILIYSSHANDSPQVRREVKEAFDRDLTVIPFRLEEVPMKSALKYYCGEIHWLDALTPPIDQHLKKLVERTRAILDQEERQDPMGKVQTEHERQTQKDATREQEGSSEETQNLLRWEQSGLPRKWVDDHRGQWTHLDWLDLLAKLKRTDFWPMEPNAMGKLLEEQKDSRTLSRSASHAEAERKQHDDARRAAEAEAIRVNTELADGRIKAEANAAHLAAERKQHEDARRAAEAEATRISTEVKNARVEAEANAVRLAAEKKQREAARSAAEAEAARISTEVKDARVEAEANTVRLGQEKQQQETARGTATNEAARWLTDHPTLVLCLGIAMLALVAGALIIFHPTRITLSELINWQVGSHPMPLQTPLQPPPVGPEPISAWVQAEFALAASRKTTDKDRMRLAGSE